MTFKITDDAPKVKKLKPFELNIRFETIEEAVFFHDCVLINWRYTSNKTEESKFGEFMPPLIGKFYNRITSNKEENFE